MGAAAGAGKFLKSRGEKALFYHRKITF